MPVFVSLSQNPLHPLCVTLDKLLTITKPQFLHLQNGLNMTDLQGIMWGWTEMAFKVPPRRVCDINFFLLFSPLCLLIFLCFSSSFFLVPSFYPAYQYGWPNRESCNAFFINKSSFISRLCLNEGSQTLKQILSSSPENNPNRFQNWVYCDMSRRRRRVWFPGVPAASLLH